MSYPLLPQDVLFYQRFLISCGCYTGKADGAWGPLTNAADAEFQKESEAIASGYGTFDGRSESSIRTLVCKAQREARKFLQLSRSAGLDIRILSGTRTYKEQDDLYAHGRNGDTQPEITNARGGESNHNFGIAWDIGIFDQQGIYCTDEAPYCAFAEKVLATNDAIEWGGNWHTFRDYPHYQLKPMEEAITAIRHRFENGLAYA